MPDRPDWYVSSPESTRVGLEDMAELAARLGSPHTFDRRGEVLFFDTFKHGLAAWSTSVSGAGAEVNIVADETYRAGLACQLIAGSDSNHHATIHRYLANPIREKMGLEIAFRFEDRIDYLSLRASFYQNEYLYFVEIRLPDTSDILQYRDAAGDYVELVEIPDPLPLAIPLWHNLKVVADLTTLEYVRCVYDRIEVDMSGETLYAASSPDYEWIYSTVSNVGNAGSNEETVVGQVIVTGAEP